MIEQIEILYDLKYFRVSNRKGREFFRKIAIKGKSPRSVEEAAAIRMNRPG